MTDQTPAGGSARASIVQNVYAFGGFAYGAINADVHVHGDGRPVYLLEEHTPATGDADPAWTEQPSRLLNARNAVVPFTGRETELGELRDWRGDGSDVGWAVRWLHGPGGRGKTRLADHFAATSAREGWKAVVVRHGGVVAPESQGSHDADPGDLKGLLILVDYADRWPLKDLTWLFANSAFSTAQGRRTPVRVLLLARTVDAWPAVESMLGDRAATSVRELEALTDELRVRKHAFTVARARFSDLYDRHDARAAVPPVPLVLPDLGLTLSLHVAALVAVDAHVHGRRAPEDMPGLSVYLLEREREYWTRLYENRVAGLDFHTSPGDMASVVFVAALTGAVPWEGAAAALERARVAASPETLRSLLRDHSRCYPALDPETVLEPPYPDRLAEDFVALMVPGHGIAGFRADAWATGIPKTLLSSPDTAACGPRALPVLAAAADRWPHLAERILYPLLQEAPDLAVDAGGAALAAIAGIHDIAPALLGTLRNALEARVGTERHIALDVGFAAIAVRLAELAPSGASEAELARLYGSASTRLGHAGRWAEAIEFSEKAERHGRRRSLTDRSVVYPENAQHVRVLRQAGRGREASSKALDVINRLLLESELYPDRHQPELAMASANHAELLRESGRPAEAVEHSLRAVDIYSKLAVADPNTHRHALATSLGTLAKALAEAGKHGEALEFSAHAVRLGNELVGLNRPAHIPELAALLDSHAQRLAESGRHGEALEFSTQAVEFYEESARANPHAHRLGLASSLTGRAERLAEAGRCEEALEFSARAVQLLGELGESDMEIHQHDLARTLLVRSGILWREGQRAEALDCSRRATDLCAALARGYLRSGAPDVLLGASALGWTYARTDLLALARALASHANLLALAGVQSEALDASSRAVEHGDRLHTAEPDTYLPDLARASVTFASVRIELGTEPNQALSAADRAFRAFQELSVAEPEAFGADLDAAAGKLSDALDALGRTDDAERIRRDPALEPRTDPDASRPSSAQAPENLRIAVLKMNQRMAERSGDRARAAKAWDELGSALESMGRVDESIEAYEQAVVAYRETQHLRRAAIVLTRLAGFLWEAGRYEEAIEVSERAVADNRETGDRQAEATALFVLGLAYEKTGRHEEAVTVHSQKAAINREQGDRVGEAAALSNVGHALMNLGRFEESVEPSRRAAELLHGTDNLLNQGIALEDVGSALLKTGRAAEAVPVFEQAASVFEEDGNRHCQGCALKDLGHALVTTGRFEEAVPASQQAVALLHEVGDRPRESAALLDLSRALQETGRLQDAVAAARAVDEIARALGDRGAEIQVLHLLGGIFLTTEQFEEFIPVGQRSAVFRRELGDRQGEGVVLCCLGDALMVVGRFEEASHALLQAAAIFRDIGDREKEAWALSQLPGRGEGDGKR
ncbi:tetratricopeptide repeat protein [Streptomyces sp. NPDC087428]|uniref:tetratricopeptide repeat protein n=1 Tax=Streptomyces sp. NPDC087428 TaxID=3365788 RepID=UPI00382D391F